MKLPKQGGFEPDAQMPPMPPMGNDMPMPDEGGGDMMGQAPDGMGDEGEDTPKKKLQQKAGKISKELSEYQGEDKEEVAKYVKGMVDKAADNIIDGDDSEAPMPDDMGGDVTTDTQMESVDRTEEMVNEIINDLMYDRGARGTKRKEKKVTNREIGHDDPFVSGR